MGARVSVCVRYLVSHLAVSISPESVTEISLISDGKTDKSFEGNELKCASFFHPMLSKRWPAATAE